MLADPAAVKNPFYDGVPEWALYPMIVLATMAAVIASQAVITGAYLGGAPGDAARLHPAHADQAHLAARPSARSTCRAINWMLMIAVIALVLAFRSSTALATAYGVSVTGTMLIDTLLLALVARARWPRCAHVGAAAVRCCSC